MIDDWLGLYPESERAGLRARLRSSDDRVFSSAFWELYLHEMYRRDDWLIQIEPVLLDVPTRPDFLVSKGSETYYVEARCTFSGSDRAAMARLQGVYASLDGIDSGAFHLAVTTVRIGKSSPPTRALRKNLEHWLGQLDPDAGDYVLNDDDPRRRFDWTCDEWHLVFHPIPRKVEVRGVRAARPLGVFVPAGAEFIDDVQSLREALADKGSKYGSLAHPLVLAINVGSGFHDDRDTEQALYGTVGWRLHPTQPDRDPVPVLTEAGYWGWPGQPSHRHVAGVLLAEGMHYGRVAQYSPTFWSHPHAAHSIDALPSWAVANPGAEGTTRSGPALPPHTFFDLPQDWPQGHRFPRESVAPGNDGDR